MISLQRRDRDTTLTPLYRQVSRAIEDQIRTGFYAPGALLPTEEQLCKVHNVSRITLRRSIDELAQRGLVVRSRGVGNFVSKPEDSTKSVLLTGFIEDVVPLNHLKVVAQSVAPLPPNVTELLQGAPQDRMKLIVAVNHVNTGPLSYGHFYFPAEPADLITGADFLGFVTPVKVVEARLGQRIHHAAQSVDAVVATAQAAEHLGVNVGTPLLHIIRGYFTDTGQLMEVVDAVFHPTRYRFNVTLLPKFS